MTQILPEGLIAVSLADAFEWAIGTMPLVVALFETDVGVEYLKQQSVECFLEFLHVKVEVVHRLICAQHEYGIERWVLVEVAHEIEVWRHLGIIVEQAIEHHLESLVGTV